MKNRSNVITFALSILCLSAESRLHAQTWVNHSVFPGEARTVLIDPTPSATPPPAFVAGSAIGGIAALAPDGGATLIAGAGPTACFRLGYDRFAGAFFAVGFAAGGNWEAHQSLDGGVSWNLIDSVSLAAQHSSARGFASDGNGNVFVCGGAADTTGYAHWIVRRRDRFGNWKTVQDFSVKRSDCYATAMCAVNGTLFVVGQSANKWMVQRGSNLGATSITWDSGYTWAPGKTGSAQARAVSADNSGNIYVFGVNGSAGFGYETASDTALLQKSTDGGNTWVIAATFKPAGSIVNRAHDMAFDSAGNLFLAGASYLSYSPKPRTAVSAWKWVVYRQEITSGLWTSTFPFGSDPTQGGDSLAKGISTDAAGNVFVTGRISDNDGNPITVVQRFQ